MKELKNILNVLKKKRYLAIFIISTLSFLLLYTFFMGLIAIPILNIQLIQMLLPTELDYVFMYVFSVLTGLVLTMFIYTTDQNRKLGNKCLGVGTEGIAAGFITSMCPFCPIWFLMAFGITGTMMFISPFYPFLKIASLILMTVSLIWISRKIHV